MTTQVFIVTFSSFTQDDKIENKDVLKSVWGVFECREEAMVAVETWLGSPRVWLSNGCGRGISTSIKLDDEDVQYFQIKGHMVN